MNSLGEESNPFLGAASEEQVIPGSIPLTILDAINRGLKYNLACIFRTKAPRPREAPDYVHSVSYCLT
jgi:hypothetical protein